MKLNEKIYQLRKNSNMSQEELADKLNISRQALSRWENGTAMPDALNILELSKLFNVSADYLLNDQYQSDNDLPKVKEISSNGLRQIMICLITAEVIDLILQFTSIIILQNSFFGFLSYLPFILCIGGFEYAYQKNYDHQNETTKKFHKQFYKISTWIGLFFPIRFIVMSLSDLYPRPMNVLVLDLIVVGIYMLVAILMTIGIDKHSK